ncbi:hypothetical protein BGZ73_005715 [Actinomortierella ambigua]|nr:hypothetical protein BGZ73_005715 [Actinomortierella ambigua]
MPMATCNFIRPNTTAISFYSITINSDTEEEEEYHTEDDRNIQYNTRRAPSIPLRSKRPADVSEGNIGSSSINEFEINECPQKRARKTVRYIDPPFHLTAAERLPPSHNVNCVTIESLLNNDKLQYMVQFNYMIDVSFVMNYIPASIRYKLRATFYHGLRHNRHEEEVYKAHAERQYPNIEIIKPFVPVPGTHHTKAMLLFYSDNTMQFILHTANLIARDWRNKTQGVFTTGILHRKSSDHLHSTCAFERDLQDYLSRYQNLEITRRVSQFDFSGVRGVVVASVPGSFSGQERNRWGHMRLRSVLRQQVELSQEAKESSKIIVQDTASDEHNLTVMVNSTMECPEPAVDLSTDAHNDITVVPIRLPYDLPLTPYDYRCDHVWLSDKWFPGLDDYGRELKTT